MPAKAITDDQWRDYFGAIETLGVSKSEAARRAGISRSTVMRQAAGKLPKYDKRVNAIKYAIKGANPDPVKNAGELAGSPAERALTDFEFFRRRYLGHVSMPWHIAAAEKMLELLETDDDEFVVVNCPPGSGKSTLFTEDLALWLIVRDRSIRMMIGSAAENTAKWYTQQLRRELERQVAIKPSDKERRNGALDGEGTLVGDFGGFKPDRGEAWRDNEFVVAQAGGQVRSTKDPTCRAFGRDSTFLGFRADFVIWDDLVTDRTMNNPETRDSLIRWFRSEAESRLEPGGLFILQGQRIHADDLYRDRLNVTVLDYDENEEEIEGSERPRYRHIIYRSHYEEQCRGNHRPTDPPYDPASPEDSGCLLDPKRLRWSKLAGIKSDDPRKYAVWYQQEDTSEEAVLVNPLWVSGGVHPETGEQSPGCWDDERPIGVVPRELQRPLLSVVTADPSPSKFWSIQWALFQPSTELRHLIDMERRAMGANDFLDYIVTTGTYTGLLEDWWQRSVKQGAPITHVIVEQNAAQKFLLQYDYVKKWQALRKVRIVPHNTYANKTDPMYGVQATLPQVWRFGRIRLPGHRLSGSRERIMPLVREVTRWPDTSTTDCVMAEWFFEFNISRLRQEVEAPSEPYRMPGMPSWMRGGLRSVG
jgi:hypothetical protein